MHSVAIFFFGILDFGPVQDYADLFKSLSILTTQRPRTSAYR